MKAFQVTDFDSNPTIEDIPKPTPTPNQIRIKIMACGLNFADLLMQNGSYQDTPELPFVLGMEVRAMKKKLLITLIMILKSFKGKNTTMQKILIHS